MLKGIIIGAGNRGTAYARVIRAGKQAAIAAICDPRQDHLATVAKECGEPSPLLFDDWRKIAEMPGRIADFAIIATQDQDHLAPVLALAEKGYHLLLEKPMAPNLADCEAIAAAVQKSGVVFGVCHVLRYTPYWSAVKQTIDSGVLGEIAGIQHLESVVYWHMAHAFVRGNWRNSQASSPILLAKSCHDMDILRFLAGRACRRVSSFGSPSHFTPANQPPESAGELSVADGFWRGSLGGLIILSGICRQPQCFFLSENGVGDQKSAGICRPIMRMESAPCRAMLTA